jgi:hypothetical protein
MAWHAWTLGAHHVPVERDVVSEAWNGILGSLDGVSPLADSHKLTFWNLLYMNGMFVHDFHLV